MFDADPCLVTKVSHALGIVPTVFFLLKIPLFAVDFFVVSDIMYWAKKHTHKKNLFFAAIPNTLGWREFSTNSLKPRIRLLTCSHLQETCSRKVSRLQKIEHPQAECKFSCYFELWSLFSNKVAKQ